MSDFVVNLQAMEASSAPSAHCSDSNSWISAVCGSCHSQSSLFGC